jgi:hypothetical protein
LYLDDIILLAQTFDDTLKHLEEALQRLKKANLKLIPRKCHFFQKQVTFLGHVVSEERTSTCPKKYKSVKEWPTSRNVSDVKSFLGLVSFNRKYICQFSNIAKPLHTFEEKDKKFEWTIECENAVKALKTA